MTKGLVVIALLIAANVVAAGVVLVLGKGLQAVAPALHSPWLWLAVGAAGAFAAYFFLRGAMRVAAWRPFVGFADPKKGLKSIPRGG